MVVDKSYPQRKCIQRRELDKDVQLARNTSTLRSNSPNLEKNINLYGTPPEKPKGQQIPLQASQQTNSKKKTVRLSSPRNIQRIRIRKVQRIFGYANIKNNLSRVPNLNIESSTDFLEICIRLSSTNPENDRYVHPPSNAEAPRPLFHGQHDTTTVQIHTNLQH